ncbi:HAD-IA family hydrolase [Parasphaerochaeta coccoides]|uniref:HAD-superfamily hydrolase, subfamily IA, variant 1 n=1 Tax=Parasphaerochaeta coccoides (strain ATCC BAA-1237 / DSM 17374 / SPN1) TaxID=760011 RepID=F4GJI8_PARC1|nr:HAD-IA family hydrolase [Parasphaerochaeta coccoides]AEC02253.1 HAD-superfamily hydrolase, subfamily IA, variant 1 [Parasphaerochaeta coccoides DSM 17374]
MRFTTVLFDLDGTLMDTSPGIFASVRHALSAIGWPQSNQEKLNLFVGPPLKDCFRLACDMTDDEVIMQAAAIYREKYNEAGPPGSSPYPGMTEVLETLRSEGILLGVATLKPEPLAHEVLRYNGIEHYFDYIAGADFDGAKTKAMIIETCMDALGVSAEETVMVGDTPHDLEGARIARVPLIAVDWGFGFVRGYEGREDGVMAVARAASDIIPILNGSTGQSRP